MGYELQQFAENHEYLDLIICFFFYLFSPQDRKRLSSKFSELTTSTQDKSAINKKKRRNTDRLKETWK